MDEEELQLELLSEFPIGYCTDFPVTAAMRSPCLSLERALNGEPLVDRDESLREQSSSNKSKKVESIFQ